MSCKDRKKFRGIIVVTHEHYDHFEAGFTVELQRRTNAVIVTTPFVARQIRVPEDNLKAMMVGDSLTIGGVGLNINSPKMWEVSNFTLTELTIDLSNRSFLLLFLGD